MPPSARLREMHVDGAIGYSRGSWVLFTHIASRHLRDMRYARWLLKHLVTWQTRQMIQCVQGFSLSDGEATFHVQFRCDSTNRFSKYVRIDLGMRSNTGFPWSKPPGDLTVT